MFQEDITKLGYRRRFWLVCEGMIYVSYRRSCIYSSVFIYEKDLIKAVQEQ